MRIWDLGLALLKAKAEPSPRWGTGGGQAAVQTESEVGVQLAEATARPLRAVQGGLLPTEHQARSLRTLSVRSG